MFTGPTDTRIARRPNGGILPFAGRHRRKKVMVRMTRSAAVADNDATLATVDGFSLEMTGKDQPALLDAASLIPGATKVNVTFLGNENLELRVAASKVVRELGFTPVPHLSARRLPSQRALEEFLERLRDVDAAAHVFAVGGDPATPEGPYSDSLALIRTGLFADYGVREVSIAGYPEGHPDIDDATLWRFLTDKVDACKEQGLDTVILTQFGFDTEVMLDWIRRVRGRGITAPIRIGTPGPAGIGRLLRFASRFGVAANATVVKKYGFSLTNLLGSAGPDRFIDELAQGLAADPALGTVGLHFYTFGGMRATAQWIRDYVEARS